MPPVTELYDSIAYTYDGTLEGLLTAVFQAYANHQDPQDIVRSDVVQPRLGQLICPIDTEYALAERVRRGIIRACGDTGFDLIRRASLSDDPTIGTAIYRYIRFAMDLDGHRQCSRCNRRSHCPGASEHKTSALSAANSRLMLSPRLGASSRNGSRAINAHATNDSEADSPANDAPTRLRGKTSYIPRYPCARARWKSTSDITHPMIEPVYKQAKAVTNEQEHMLQFIRFKHLEGGLWFARCNPKASVVPLVMDHFSARLNTQAFIIYDEAHHLAGVYGGNDWYLVKTDDPTTALHDLPNESSEEFMISQAWKRFYRTVAVESRYNPELRRHFMPKRLWKNITELQEDLPTAALVSKAS